MANRYLTAAASVDLVETIHHGFNRAVTKWPSRIAIIADDGSLSFAELAAACLGVRIDLLNLERQSRVAVMLENSAAYAALAISITASGHILVPLSPASGSQDILRLLKDTEPDLIFARPASSPARMCVDSYAAQSAAQIIDVPAQYIRDMISRSKQYAHCSAMPVMPSTNVIGDDLAVIFGTSGTSGPSTRVVHTHGSLSASAAALRKQQTAYFGGSALQFLRRTGGLVLRYRRHLGRLLPGRQIWLTPIAFYSIAGFSLLSQCILNGRTLVTTGQFYPRRILQLTERHRATMLALSPVMAELLLRLRDFDSFDLSSVAIIGLGGSVAPPSLVRRLQNAFGCAVAVGYGSTELGGGVLTTDLLDPIDVQVSAMARPFPGVEVRLMDETGKPVPAGVEGELECKAPGLMAGYLNCGDGGRISGGWYSTGDSAIMDAVGRIRILGRMDDIIIHAGQKIHPAPIEECISKIEGVAECAVVGGERAWGDQAIVAYVALHGGADVESNVIFAACRKTLPASSVPVLVKFVSSLPRTTDGKVQRFLLRQDAGCLG
jgi:acyl-CoA synthetase (AMP-forming)/AMP-acid ligase II